ncbi:MAG: hypothetical protein IJ728_06785 [Selenomonadaceae bacterium]|nr:hypothetical protein [Selenomonadaceae bacterium]
MKDKKIFDNDSDTTKSTVEVVGSEELTEATEKVADSKEVVTSAYVDRIEEVENGINKAVMYFGDNDEKVVMPISMLPKGVKADDTLIIKVNLEE